MTYTPITIWYHPERDVIIINEGTITETKDKMFLHISAEDIEEFGAYYIGEV